MDQAPLPGTSPLAPSEDSSVEMVAGIKKYLLRTRDRHLEERSRFWSALRARGAGTEALLEPRRAELRQILGVRDPRAPSRIEVVRPAGEGRPLAEMRGVAIDEARWSVFDDLSGRGLLLTPPGRARGWVILLPDADQTPDELAGLTPRADAARAPALRLARRGFRVLIPQPVNRDCTYSGIPGLRMTNQPHREYIYRAAYETGRHIIGLELQTLFAAVNAIEQAVPDDAIGVWGYGEGGLLALYGAALDPRLKATAVSGYFGPREELWREPIYRNVWSLLNSFGDAEAALLSAPRRLIVEASAGPTVAGPPVVAGRSGGAPGVLAPQSVESVEQEWRRARTLRETATGEADQLLLVKPPGGAPWSDEAFDHFVSALGASGVEPPQEFVAPAIARESLPEERHRLVFREMLAVTQRWMRESPAERERLWAGVRRSDPEQWARETVRLRDQFHSKVIGSLPELAGIGTVRSHALFETAAVRAFRVRIPVIEEIFADGILLLPRSIKPGERRPVVVCQHGLEGRPDDLAHPDTNNPSYNQYGLRLAEQGYIVFAPQNPYRGGDRFRELQRIANPLGLSLFSVIVRQHEQILRWLAAQPSVDPARIGFYGLSYGGKTAMRVPAILPGYALSICSADFNEWIWKNVRSDSRYSYLLTGEYEMPEWNLANTFNYAEMSWLIAPRPFMVERGHHDGVAPDEWVAYEYARTRRLYVDLGIGDRSRIEFFNGPHTIHGVGTFDFLREHLGAGLPGAAGPR